MYDPLDPFKFADEKSELAAAAHDGNGVATPDGEAGVIVEPEVEDTSERGIQRASLRKLVALSAETAAAESEIERSNRAAVEKTKQAFTDKGFELEDRFKKLKVEAAKKHNARVSAADGKYTSDKTRISQDDREARSKADGEKKSVDEKVKKKLDQAMWLADSVYEVAGNQVVVGYKQATETIAASQDELNRIEVRAAERVQRYGVSLPTDEPAVEPDPDIEIDADAAFAKHHDAAQSSLDKLGRLPVASLFAGALPFIIPVVLAAGVAAAVYFLTPNAQQQPPVKPMAIYAGGTFVVVLVIGFILRVMATKQVRAVHGPLRQELALARLAVEKRSAKALIQRDAAAAAAVEARKSELAAARAQLTPHAAKATAARNTAVAAAAAETGKRLANLDKTRDAARSEADEANRRAIHDVEHKHQRDIKENKARTDAAAAENAKQYDQQRQELVARWEAGLKQIQAPIDPAGGDATAVLGWDDPAWLDWKPTKNFASRVRFGEMHVDLKQIAETVPQRLALPESFSLPALLAFPAQGSMLIDYDDTLGRTESLRTLQMMMSRLLTSLPAGRVRFTIIDPIGLGQNFAGFMHLTDYDDQLVGGRIWTSQEQIDQRMADLADHMETVIQKYLRNEFNTIDDYNHQAGQLAEPYRYLVIADLPTNFSAEAFRRLNAIASSGARCGVYTLVARDARATLPAGAHLDGLLAHSVHLVRQEERFVWDDEVFKQLPLALDAPPSEAKLTDVLHKVGAGAKEAKRVEVPFEVIAPDAEHRWSGSTTSELDVMVGRSGATRFQSLKLGKGTSQHVLIAGKTGSGKSTLMHAMITNAALWYSPDEVELYLVDFKKGVEFKTYATNLLPHARAIAVESDREFGLSLLTRLDVELARRGELFRKAGVQDLGSYRKSPNADVVPRTLLIIDEFQEFFTEDDKLAQEAAILIERLVRQGRAFGMHVLLGSQTIGGAGGLPRAVLGQFAVRIALQTTEADSQMILGDNNSAARLLTRPGEAIYNDAGGLVEGNSPFQVAYLSDAKRDAYLKDLASKAKPYFERFGYPIVFEGNAAADPQRNGKLVSMLDAKAWPKSLGSAGALAYLGEPVAIKDPTSIAFRRQAGTNVLVVGQADEQAIALLTQMMISIAAQQGPEKAIFYVLDGTPADSVLAGTFDRVRDALPHDVKMVDFRNTADAIDEVAQEVARRQEADEQGAPSIYVFIYGMQRYRTLRKAEEDFSFSLSTSDEPKKANTGKQFVDILKEGPPLGVHIIAWADTLVAIDRTLDRGTMREFDNRILFQMSAADSSNLIDSPSANKLGFFRALTYSEEQGTIERFRPYAVPDANWLATVKKKLDVKPTSVVNA